MRPLSRRMPSLSLVWITCPFTGRTVPAQQPLDTAQLLRAQQILAGQDMPDMVCARLLKFVGYALRQDGDNVLALALTANANNQAQAQLRQQVASTDQLLAQRNSQIKRLYRENETLRRWADTPLPDDIIRLR
ncbi:LysB family phage lysis regulatory protein [Yersinia sp. Marseille-Q3913]|uniref:LysB family phage lysis regulatory protein n=2 Tax=Yersinia sp. Marseille-Q3913 TaxID=2830769 RepID=UPI002010E168|nr:LysB family phage lysis regulatory protein [Yersinia sp. Marseille-Q3913]